MMKRPVIFFACTVCMAMASEEPTVAFVELTAPGTPAEMSNPKAVPAPAPRTTLWSIGEPTADEQLYLELINRARNDPAAEGIRLAGLTDTAILQAYSQFGVNLTLMKSEMALLGRAWPLAMNARLMASARGHSNWMLANNKQDHDEPGRDIYQRAVEQGYAPATIAENIYNASKSTEYGHAGFEVDWGPGGSGGMLAGRGHRTFLHAGYREIGIGIKNGTNGGSGPQVVTQDLAVPASPGGIATPFVTGVAYFDSNGNSFYDPGEGLGGLQVTVEGALYHGVTAASGGYSVPVPAIPSGGTAITRAVTFSGGGFLYNTTALCKPSNWSVKVDCIPVHAALNGPVAPLIATPTYYTLSGVPGASGHEWRYMRRTPAVTDGANDATRITASLSSPLSTGVKQEGSASYQLHHALGRDEYIVHRDARVAGPAPVLRYYSRLGYALSSQKAYVQVSTDNGQTWTTLETQTGSGGTGQSTFSQRTVPLTAVAGKEFKLRFYYGITGSPYANSSSNGNGWYIDNISFTDVLDTLGAVSASVPTTNSVTFTPPSSGEWLLSARPTISGRTLSFGPSLAVNAISTPPPPTFGSWATEQEAAAGLPAGTISANGSGDYNHDGVPNLVAYALGLSATQPAGHQLPRPSKQGANLVLDYARESSRADVTVTPQISSDFRTWYAPGQAGAPAGFSDTLLGTAGTLQSRRALLPFSSGTRWVMRLKVTLP